MLGSIDANRGDYQNGWDTDQFPTDIYLTTSCMLSLMKFGGIAPGGVNFDAKVRREPQRNLQKKSRVADTFLSRILVPAPHSIRKQE